MEDPIYPEPGGSDPETAALAVGCTIVFLLSCIFWFALLEWLARLK